VPTVAYGLERRPMEHVRAGDAAVPKDRVGSFVGVGIPTIRRHGAVIWVYGLHWLSLPMRDSWPCRKFLVGVMPQRDARTQGKRRMSIRQQPRRHHATGRWIYNGGLQP